MRKHLLLMSILLLIPVLLVVSCVNIKPNVEYRVTLKLPIAATRIDFLEILEEYIQDNAGDLDISTSDGTPVVLRMSTSLYTTSLDDFEELFPDASFTLINWEESVPTFQNLEMNLDFKTPVFPDMEEDVYVVIPPESTLDFSTDLILDTGVSSSDLMELTINGEILVAVSIPPDWKNVDFAEMEVILIDGEGKVIASGETNSQDITLELPHKQFEVGNGKLSVHLSVALRNEGPLVNGTIGIHVYPNLEIERLKDLHLGIKRTVKLEDPIQELIFEGGTLTLHSEQFYFENATGTVQSRNAVKNLQVLNGDVIIDLRGLSLPATLTIDSLTASVLKGIENVQVIGYFDDVVVHKAVLNMPDLDIEGSYTYVSHQNEPGIEEISFSKGDVFINYEVDFPINVRLWSEYFDPPLDERFSLSPESSEYGFDLSNVSLNFQDNSFVIEYEASPENYDGEHLVLESLKLGKRITLSATMNVQDLVLSRVVLSDVSTEFASEIDPGGFDPLIPELLKSLKNISASLGVNAPVDGKLLITINDSSYTVSLREGENGLPWIKDLLMELFSTVEDSSEYEILLNIERVEIGTEGFEASLNADIPLDFSIPSSVVLMDVSTVVRLDLDIGSVVDSATIMIEGKNENTLRPTVSIYINGRKASEFNMSGDFHGILELTQADIQSMIYGGLPVNVEVFLSGDQMLSRGDLDIAVKLQVGITLRTGGE